MKILFVAPYANDENVKEGYMQRIKNIDNLLSDIKCDYITIYLHPRHKMKEIIINDKRTIYQVNLLRDRKLIKGLINKYDYIYFHSIYTYRLLFWFITTQKTILDFHGTVPEELFYEKKYFSSFIHTFIEKIAAQKIMHIIFVSMAMQKYFNIKYPKSKAIKHIFPIIAKNALRENTEKSHELLRNISNEDNVYFIYSGNTQKWQNIELMFNFIEKHDNEKYVYIILSGSKEYFNKIISERFYKIRKRFIVDSVLPEELYQYYSIAHYGFILRDDHILNRVANPTKMLEYLFYGITPIVKLKEIGDFFNYENISIFDNNITFSAHKSDHNKIIAKKILLDYENIKFREDILFINENKKMQDITLYNKKILYLGIGFYDYDRAIIDKLTKEGASVTYYNLSPINFVSRIILHIPYFSKRWIEKYYNHLLMKYLMKLKLSFNYIFVIKGENINQEHCIYLKKTQASAKFILYLYDSVIRIKNINNIFSFFDKILSFDTEDVKKYGFIFRPTFFRPELLNYRKNKRTYDIAFVGFLHSDRLLLLQKIIDVFKETNLNILFIVLSGYIQKAKILIRKKTRKNDPIKIITKPLNFNEYCNILSDSKCIIDIHHPLQSGLTMRCLDALAMGCFIITTNKYITEYKDIPNDTYLIIDRNNILLDNLIQNKIVNYDKKVNVDKYSLDVFVHEIFL